MDALTIYIYIYAVNQLNRIQKVVVYFTSSHLHNNELNKRYAYLACCSRRGLRAR